MIVALVLLGYAAFLATAGLWALCRARWADRAPRLAIAAWQALSFAFTGSVVLGGLALSVPTVRVSTDLAGLLRACVAALRAQYAAPGGASLAASGAVLAVGVLVRVGYCLAATLSIASAERRSHRERLDMIGRADLATGTVVINHDTPAAYCLPGLRRRIVLSTGALNALDPGQLAAVLAHERAHLRGRHDLIVGLATALERAFPRLPLFRTARAQIERLIELAADDAATRATHRLTLAEAMLALAQRPSPAGTLAATGSATGMRVRRLIAGERPLGRPWTALGALVAAVVLAIPLALVAGPAAAMAGTACCPLDAGGPPQCQALAVEDHCPLS
jgi:Zn-dependent protease with chaperone function